MKNDDLLADFVEFISIHLRAIIQFFIDLFS